jgi:voltage-gated potassium channel
MTSADRSLAAEQVSRRQVTMSVVRMLFTTAVLTGIYAAAPLELPEDGSTAARLALSIIVLFAVLTWQILSVARSAHPRARALEAVAVIFPLLIFLFASTYYAMEQARPESFNEALSRTDAVYLTVTVLATVGFGDIVATTETSRLVVTIQMIVDLALIGVVAKVLLNTVRQRRAALAGVTAPDDSRDPVD